MSLPNKIQHQAITGASLPSTIDNDINATKLAVLDIFGIPDNTNISAAVMSVAATGLTAVVFRDAAGNPATAGHLQRNGTLLNFYDGAANRILVSRDLAETLTNKTIAIGSNTFSGTTAQFNTALSDNDFATLAGSETFTNKSIDLASNTVTGTTAQFNTALSDGSFATLAGSEALTNKTLTSPTITSPTISSGAITLTSGQITFPASQAASADTHTLDDYEEGTWVPAIGGTATYFTQEGTYVKVGKLVHISCLLTINARGTGSQTTISGLPFSVQSRTTSSVEFSGAAATYVTLIMIGNNGASTVSVEGLTAAGAAITSQNAIADGSSLLFSMSYIASS